ncbi:MAG: hypothetical protein WCV68_04620 [Candidatus Paceibacterota bacterium]|jgi:hypothetical protein
MKNKLIVLSGLALSLSPVVAFAQSTGGRCTGVGLGTIEGIICKIGDILNIIIPILIVLGIVFFVWGVITFVVSADEEQKTKGRDKMIYGIIGLAVIIGMWGLVKILSNTFGIENNLTPTSLPTVPY